MGCLVCTIARVCSAILDSAQRISLCAVSTLLTCCILMTIMFVGAVGIGIGYHYCIVQNKVQFMVQMHRPMNQSLMLREGMDINLPLRRHMSRRDAEDPANNNLTMHENIPDDNFTDVYPFGNFSFENVTKLIGTS